MSCDHSGAGCCCAPPVPSLFEMAERRRKAREEAAPAAASASAEDCTVEVRGRAVAFAFIVKHLRFRSYLMFSFKGIRLGPDRYSLMDSPCPAFVGNSMLCCVVTCVYVMSYECGNSHRMVPSADCLFDASVDGEVPLCMAVAPTGIFDPL